MLNLNDLPSGWSAGTSGNWPILCVWPGLVSPVKECGIYLEVYSASVFSKEAPVPHRKCLSLSSLCAQTLPPPAGASRWDTVRHWSSEGK